jgi:3'-phosphoadenosine 5'-phosphosulfate sulfotransferase (PAPS reductase)/FAD synthetase
MHTYASCNLHKTHINIYSSHNTHNTQGRRKSQGGDRLYLPLIEVDKADGRVKLNPLANWAKEDVWRYIRQNKLPYNKLHDQGYQSIGDVVTTEKTPPESGERAGVLVLHMSYVCMHLLRLAT